MNAVNARAKLEAVEAELLAIEEAAQQTSWDAADALECNSEATMARVFGEIRGEQKAVARIRRVINSAQ